MGYSTSFMGDFTLSRPVTKIEKDYLFKFTHTLRGSYDVKQLAADSQEMYGMPNYNNKKNRTPEDIYGADGSYYVGDNFKYLLRNNNNGLGPTGYCQWILGEDDETLIWDGGEKFYYYVEWLEYLIKYIFGPWGIKLNGTVFWSGDDVLDTGKIVIKDNYISVYYPIYAKNINNVYCYVKWPESQEYMDEPWFEHEAILDVNNDAAYFIPIERMN